MPRYAVVLMNLGGPDAPDAVFPFLKNLFSDPRILRYPAFIRKPLAHVIAKLRLKSAQKNYDMLGGGSPLLQNTLDQAQTLEKMLQQQDPDITWKTFVCMRYWHPRAEEVAREVKKFGPQRIILLPLYPQFSTTTTASSFEDWDQAARKQGLSVSTRRTCCYPRMAGFVRDIADQIRMQIAEMGDSNTRVLFSAHGLPESIVKKGDPYVWQVQQTMNAILHVLNIPIDARLCFQSRVGPVPWVKPYLDEEIKVAGNEAKKVLIVPIAFVSEHSETLIELDHEYQLLADQAGVPLYRRIQTVGTSMGFMEGLVQRVMAMLEKDYKLLNPTPGCPKEFCGCYTREFKKF